LVTVVVFGGGGWVRLGLKHLNAEPARDSAKFISGQFTRLQIVRAR
jgi:hypothetical protein